MASSKKKDTKKYVNAMNEDELHPENVEFMEQAQAFYEKVLAHGDLLEKINQRVVFVGRENIILDPLFEILQILTSCQEKLN